jgi:hypothetical protein
VGLLAVTLIGIAVMHPAKIGARAYADVAAPPKLAASQCSGTPGLACSGVAALLFSPAAMPSASSVCDALSRCSVTNSRLQAVALAIVTTLLDGCATERSDGAPCPPVVNYSREFLARAADELASLPAGSAISKRSPTTR